MKVEIITNWRLWLWIVSIVSFVFSVVNFFLGKYITSKIVGNDLRHAEKDIKELKTNEKEYRVDLKGQLNRIFKRLGKIEKEIVRREAICETRHGKK